MGKIFFQLDGQPFPKSVIENFSFEKDFNERDWQISTQSQTKTVKFVGFIIRNDSILVSLPKHYCRVSELNSLTRFDLELLFKVLITSNIRNQITNVNEKEEFSSTYPFKSFLRILGYYKKYGLYQETEEQVIKGYQGKISWKDTRKKSSIIINHGNLINLPLFIKKNKQRQVFLSECMMFALRHTIDTFPFFVSEKVPFSYPKHFDFWSNRDFVIAQLRKIKSEIFKDLHKNLVDDLIDFFTNIEKSGDTIIKHYKFDNVWENLVDCFLSNHFVRMDNISGIITTERKGLSFFSQKEFNDVDINSDSPEFKLKLDHYYRGQDFQYIFDSKYYNEIKGLNYKQLSYHQVLMGIENGALDTYSALIIPTSEKNSCRKHFELNGAYSLYEKPIVIWEYYLNIKQAMLEYIHL